MGMQQIVALKHLIRFLEGNEDLPSAEIRMTPDGPGAWRVAFVLPQDEIEPAVRNASLWAVTLGEPLEYGDPVVQGDRAVQGFTARRCVATGLTFELSASARFPFFGSVRVLAAA